ncbi:acyl-CoA dehydratase activase [Thermodesulfobacteriota bacterium]
MNNSGYVAGIDIGSLTAKFLILQENTIVAQEIIFTGASGKIAPYRVMEAALKKANLSLDDIGYIVATGYGRISVPFADKQVTEITCHARGAHYLVPSAKAIIDVGGQDSKVIKLGDAGKVAEFAMNDKCAAGSGRFLDVMAGALEEKVESMGSLSLKSTNRIEISSTCTVFAESEVVTHIAAGVPKEDIIAGVHYSIAAKVAGLFKSRIRDKFQEAEVVMTGGVAQNIGVVRILEEKLGCKITIPPEPQTVGALGAALIAKDQVSRL